MATSTTLSNCDKSGAEYTLYYNTGTCGTPVWVEHIGIMNDVSIGETDDESELPLRQPSILVKLFTVGKTDLSISGEQAADPLYEGWSFLNAMRNGGEPGDVMVLSDDLSVVGATGWRGKWWNIDRSETAPQSGSASKTFNLRPAACTDCTVRPVQVAVANTAADFDPGTFVGAA